MLPADAEWLLTDGCGGYGCGTVSDLPMRRYHGWWIARPQGMQRRHMLVAGADERLQTASGEVSLLHAHWATLPRAVPPPARVQFVHRPFPQWTFRTGEHTLERSLLLRRAAAAASSPALLVRWRNLGTKPQRLVVRPLLGCNDADHLRSADQSYDNTVEPRGASWGFRPVRSLPVLFLTAGGVASFRGEPVWYRGFLYETDKVRGYDHVGDRWSPGALELDLAAGTDAFAAFSLGEPCGDPRAAFELAAAHATRRAAAVAAAADQLRARIELGADDFIYETDGGRRGVLAGFPWFAEWGRDVFVSLPGLTLARGDVAGCERVLTGALPFLRGGLLPNIYGRDAADSHYDSGDAALWWALAVQRYAAAGGDRACVQQQLVPGLRSIADAYVRGTDLGLRVDAAGLLHAGRVDLNATWMDARIDKVPVTPRAGQPVEIQAMWYSLLAFLVEQGETRFAELRDRCGASFVGKFWLGDEKYLADRVHEGVADRTVRPNMVIAAALPLSPLTAAQRAGVVQKAKDVLLTPRGLRTLSPQDPAYRARYGEVVLDRDRSYHQGTVWPWLLGFYVEAALRAATKARLPRVRTELRAVLDGFVPELDRAGLDHASEVFDGDAPQLPGGTFAQAWNTGELLRALSLLSDPRFAGGGDPK